VEQAHHAQIVAPLPGAAQKFLPGDPHLEKRRVHGAAHCQSPNRFITAKDGWLDVRAKATTSVSAAASVVKDSAPAPASVA
jgi:hypothetical protein